MPVTIILHKKCTVCLLSKPVEENFYRIGNRYRAACKACMAKKNARYRATHPDESKARSKAWRAQNPDYQKQWTEANPEKVRGYAKRRKKDADCN